MKNETHAYINKDRNNKYRNKQVHTERKKQQKKERQTYMNKERNTEYTNK